MILIIANPTIIKIDNRPIFLFRSRSEGLLTEKETRIYTPVAKKIPTGVARHTEEAPTRGPLKKNTRTKSGRRAGKRIQKRARIVGEGIFNLSSQELSMEELAVLDKGL